MSYLILLLGKVLTFKNNIKLIMHPLADKRIKNHLPNIFIFWHHDIPLLLFYFRKSGFYPLISLSKDGQLLIPILKIFKYGVIRGSSTRGSMTALRNGIDVLKNGKSIVITPDGPVGPRYSFKKGAFYYAKNTGVPIIPVAAALYNKWTAHSWDRMEIPKPFGLGVISMGEPIFINEDDNIQDKIPFLKKKLLGLEQVSEKSLAKRVQLYYQK